MQKRHSWLSLALLLIVFMISSGSAQIRDHSATSKKSGVSAKAKPSAKNGFKPFAELIKDRSRSRACSRSTATRSTTAS